ncbi:MAG: hypothetical protein AB1798_23470, partial [Spirochaetota bacterium]
VSAFGGTTELFYRHGALGFLYSIYSITIMDISEPKNLHVVGHINTLSALGIPLGMTVVENLLVIPMLEKGLKAMDISRLEDPQVVDFMPEIEFAEDVTSLDHWLFIAAGTELKIIDLTNPQNPIQKRNIPASLFRLPKEKIPQGYREDFTSVESVRFTDNGYLVVVGGKIITKYDSEDVKYLFYYSTVDIRNPNESKIVDVGLFEYTPFVPPKIIGNRVFFIVLGGLDIFEVSDEGAFLKLGEIIPESRDIPSQLGFPALDGNFLYSPYLKFYEGIAPILKYDISDIKNPRLVEDFTMIGQSLFVEIIGDTFFYEELIDNPRLIARDLRKSNLPIIGELIVSVMPDSIGAEGSVISTIDTLAGRFMTYDIHNPNIPKFLGFTTAQTSGMNMTHFGNYAIADKTIFDVVDPQKPKLLGKLTISIPREYPEVGIIPDAAITVNHLFTHHGGIYVLAETFEDDLLKPYLISYAYGQAEPLEQIAYIPLSTTPEVAALGDHYLVVGSGSRADLNEVGKGTVAIYDVRNPSAPRFHNTFETGAVDALAIDGNRLFVAVIGPVGSQNIYVYDINENTIEQLPSYISLDGAFSRQFLHDQEIFLIARDGILYGAFNTIS